MKKRIIWILFLIALVTNLGFDKSNIKQHRLENGVNLITYRDTSYPVIHIKIFIKGGMLIDTQPGISYMTMKILAKGSQGYKEKEYYEKLDMLGANVSFSASDDFNLISIKQRTDKGIEPLNFILQNMKEPNFDAEVFSEVKTKIRAEIENRKNYPINRLFDRMKEVIYKDEKYMYPVIGTSDSIEEIELSDVEESYKRLFHPDLWTVVIAGDFDQDYITQLSQYLADYLNDTVEIQIEYGPAFELEADTIIHFKEEGNQKYVFVASKFRYRDINQYAVLKLLANYLGGNAMNSVLFKLLREQLGVSYAPAAFFNTRIGPSIFGIYFDVQKEKGETAYENLFDEIKKLRAGEIDIELLEAARENLKNSALVNLSDNSTLAWYLGFYQIETGDYRNLFRYLSILDNVSKDNIRHAVNSILRHWITIIQE